MADANPPDFRALLEVAKDEASRRSASSIEAEHELLALLEDPTARAARLVAPLGLTYHVLSDALAREWAARLAVVGIDVDSLADRLRAAPRVHTGRPSFSASAKEAWIRAERLLHSRSSRAPRSVDIALLVGILTAELGTVPRALALAGIDRQQLITVLKESL